MAAGVPPIRASKARYYVDPRFTSRILAPPPPARTPRRADDDWTPRSGEPAPVLLLPGPGPDGRRAPPAEDGDAKTGAPAEAGATEDERSDEKPSELQALMGTPYALLCLKKKN